MKSFWLLLSAVHLFVGFFILPMYLIAHPELPFPDWKAYLVGSALLNAGFIQMAYFASNKRKLTPKHIILQFTIKFRLQ